MIWSAVRPFAALLAVAGLYAAGGASVGAARSLREAQPRARPAPPDLGCMVAITAAERAHGIPTGLLMAIARVESGRLDPGTKLFQPWPWTIDVGGRGVFFDTRAQAVTYVEDIRRIGVASIDTGCLQVNLLQHPTAFRSVAEAFDPVINADYGARFLADLYRETRDWGVASGYYHSRTPELSIPYRVSVTAGFPALQPSAALPDPVRPLQLLANAWSSTMSPASVAPMGSSPVPAKPVRPRRLARNSALMFSAR